MKATTQQTYGGTDVLHLRDVTRPQIRSKEMLVRVHAADVDRGVWHLMTGRPYPVRLAGYGLRAPKKQVPGGDLAGVVEAVGNDVSRFRPGEEVFGTGRGSFAEYARAEENKLAPQPAQLSFEQAAAVPISGLTALQAVRDHARAHPGHRVLLIGASGRGGTYVVQLAKAYGATVTGVCRTDKKGRRPGRGGRARRRLHPGGLRRPDPLRRPDHRHRRQRLPHPAAAHPDP